MPGRRQNAQSTLILAMKLDGQIWCCDHYMIIFGLGIPAKHGQVGQAKPGFPHFADVLMAEDHWKLERFATDIYFKFFNWSRQRKNSNDVTVKQEDKVREGSKSKKHKASLSAQVVAVGGSNKSKLEPSLACKFIIFTCL